MERNKNTRDSLWKLGSPGRYPSVRAAAAAVAKRREKGLLHKQFLSMRKKCLNATYASASLLCSEQSAQMVRRLSIQRRTRKNQQNRRKKSQVRSKSQVRRKSLTPTKKSKRRKKRRKKKMVPTRQTSSSTAPPSYADAPSVALAPTSSFTKMLPPTTQTQSNKTRPKSDTKILPPTTQTQSNKNLPKSDTKMLPPTTQTQFTEVTKFPEQIKATIDIAWSNAITRPMSAPQLYSPKQLVSPIATPKNPPWITSKKMSESCKWIERPSHQALFGSSPSSPSTRTAWNGGRHRVTGQGNSLATSKSTRLHKTSVV